MKMQSTGVAKNHTARKTMVMELLQKIDEGKRASNVTTKASEPAASDEACNSCYVNACHVQQCFLIPDCWECGDCGNVIVT